MSKLSRIIKVLPRVTQCFAGIEHSVNEIEANWLEHAWQIVNCPETHLRRCQAAGGAVPGQGRVDGNELRWPGYLGRGYPSEGGILCVGAVHREERPDDEKKNPVIGRTNRELATATRHWMASGRTATNDVHYLESVRTAYEVALPEWSRWRRHFRRLIEDYLKLDLTQIAWTNLAKCRAPIHRGAAEQRAEAKLTRLCQRDFCPMSDLIDLIRPQIVLTCVLRAGREGGIVSSWNGKLASPRVYAWHGRNGLDPSGRRLQDWAPTMVQETEATVAKQG